METIKRQKEGKLEEHQINPIFLRGRRGGVVCPFCGCEVVRKGEEEDEFLPGENDVIHPQACVSLQKAEPWGVVRGEGQRRGFTQHGFQRVTKRLGK